MARYDVIPRVGASELTDRARPDATPRDGGRRRMERRFAAHVDHHAVGSCPVEVPLRGTPLATLADALVDATNTLGSVLCTRLRPTVE